MLRLQNLYRKDIHMPNIFDDTENMEDIGAIYTRLEGNCPTPSSTSKKLWILRQKNEISPCNKSSEKILEKAVALLAYNGYMPGWFNQCPAASGITDSANNKHSNVDLVHWSALHKRARLVELKIGEQRSALCAEGDSAVRGRIRVLPNSQR